MIPTERAHLYVAAITHPGMRGKNNEDRYGVTALRLEGRGEPSVLAIVSDGIGGHRAGEVAAEMAVSIISQTVMQSNGSQPEATLKDAIIRASEAIHQQSITDPDQRGMGATVICAWVIGDRLYSASVGDSRLYLVRSGAIRKLNIDHTWIQEAIEHGAITPEQARGHPNAHVIRRYLGSPQQVIPDLRIKLSPDESDNQAERNQGLRLLPEDILVLCSDGLHDLVEDHEILEVMTGGRLEENLEKLVNMANERGGHDNITIVSLQVPKAGAAQVFPAGVLGAGKAAADEEITQALRPREPALAAAPRSQRLFAITCGVLAGLLLLSIGVFTAVSLISSQPTPTLTATQTATITPTRTRMPTTTPRGGMLSTPAPRLTSTQDGPFIPLPLGQPTLTFTPWPTNTLPVENQ